MRGLLTFKKMISRVGDKKQPLFKVSTEFHYMKVITTPHQNEIRVTMNNLTKMVKEIASYFIRWKNNTCVVYDNEGDCINVEDMHKYSYYQDILENKTIKLLSVELSEIKKNAFSRLEKYKSVWEEDKGNFHDVYSNFK